MLFVLAAAAVAMAAGCGAEDQVDAAESPPAVPDDAVVMTGESSVEIIVGDNNFEPQVIVISPDTQVKWTNTGRNRHNVISADDEPTFEQIDTEQLDEGGSADRTFSVVGAYPYYCSIHGSPNRGQRGSILVLPTNQ